LGNEEALVEYVAGDSVCCIFVVTKQGMDVNTVRHNGKLTGNVLAFRNALRNLDLAGYTRNAYELYRTLIAPVRRKLTGIVKLVIIPDGVLHHLPFEALLMKPAHEALPDFSRLSYLLNDYEIRYHASASMMTSEVKREIAERSDAGFAGLAPVFADKKGATNAKKGEFAVTTRAIRLDGTTYPALPASEDEVRRIARVFDEHRQPATMYLHGKASESVLKDPSLRRHAYLHIASHGFINETNPKLSGLLFAKDGGKEDGVLYTGETYNLNLDADLVVLSACESGLGKVVRGEGILGLTRGFLYAGASNVLVSLWQVADKSTADLMVEFYRNILKSQPYSTALRNAKLVMIKAGKYAYPLEWGPFVLVGR
jgi:CHAT domain-containing protein